MATHSFRPSPKPARRRLRLAVAAIALAGAASTVGALSLVSPASAALGAAKSTDIGLKSLQFDPKKVTVAKGTKVNFVWKERVAHNIVFDAARKSPTQNKGVWTITVDKPGTYKYKCTLHPGMNGEITVK